MYSDYLNRGMQVLNVVIFTMGAFFVIMHLSGRFHKDFLPRGLWILLGAVFTAIDLFVLPELETPLAVMRWTALQHALFAWVGLAIMWDVTWLLKWPQPKLMLSIVLSNSLFSVFVFWPGFLELPLTAAQHPAGGPLYLWGGIYLLGVGLMPLPFLAARMIRPLALGDRNSVTTFAVGYGLVVLLGLMDWADVQGWSPFASVPYTLFGFLCVTALGGISLIRRLLAMHTTLIHTLEELKTAYRELDDSRSLSKLGELTSRISHDIANYCTTLSGQAYYLSKCFEVPEAQRSLGTITTTSERLATLAREVMALASGGVSVQREPMNLQQLVQEVMRGETFADRARFELHWASTQSHILGEWHKMERVFINLFQNAVDARRPSQAEAEIQVHVEERQGHFIIAVADQGVGLEETQCARIFEPFVSSKGNSGTGLGLVIVRTIVNAHGGRVDARPLAWEGGAGAVFTITLPICSEVERVLHGRDVQAVLLSADEGILELGQGLLRGTDYEWVTDLKELESHGRHERRVVFIDAGSLRGLAPALVEEMTRTQVCYLLHRDARGRLQVLDYRTANYLGELSMGLLHRIRRQIREYLPPAAVEFG